MLKTKPPAPISHAASIESVDLTEKINLLSENVQSLLDKDDDNNKQIQTVKSDFAATVKGLSFQINLINVSWITCI